MKDKILGIKRLLDILVPDLPEGEIRNLVFHAVGDLVIARNLLLDEPEEEFHFNGHSTPPPLEMEALS